MATTIPLFVDENFERVRRKRARRLIITPEHPSALRKAQREFNTWSDKLAVAKRELDALVFMHETALRLFQRLLLPAVESVAIQIRSVGHRLADTLDTINYNSRERRTVVAVVWVLLQEPSELCGYDDRSIGRLTELDPEIFRHFMRRDAHKEFSLDRPQRRDSTAIFAQPFRMLHPVAAFLQRFGVDDQAPPKNSTAAAAGRPVAPLSPSEIARRQSRLRVLCAIRALRTQLLEELRPDTETRAGRRYRLRLALKAVERAYAMRDVHELLTIQARWLPHSTLSVNQLPDETLKHYVDAFKARMKEILTQQRELERRSDRLGFSRYIEKDMQRTVEAMVTELKWLTDLNVMLVRMLSDHDFSRREKTMSFVRDVATSYHALIFAPRAF